MRKALRAAIQTVKEHPFQFHIDTWVLLPDLTCIAFGACRKMRRFSVTVGKDKTPDAAQSGHDTRDEIVANPDIGSTLSAMRMILPGIWTTFAGTL
jgi:hypothetical protein